MINTKRGKEEPDPIKDPAAWQASNQSQWLKFNDDEVSQFDLN